MPEPRSGKARTRRRRNMATAKRIQRDERVEEVSDKRTAADDFIEYYWET